MALFPISPRRPSDRIESARAARLRADRLILRMPDVTPVRLAKLAPTIVAIARPARQEVPLSLQARVGAIAAAIFAGSARRSSLRGSEPQTSTPTIVATPALDRSSAPS